MDVQIIIAVVATGVASVAVVVTLCLAVLRGFRWLYDKIDSVAKEFREDNAALAKGIAKNTAAIAGIEGRMTGIEGRMTVMETMLKVILHAVWPGSGNAAVSPPVDVDIPPTGMEIGETGDGNEDGSSVDAGASQAGAEPSERTAAPVVSNAGR